MKTLGIRMYVGNLLVTTTALQLARQRLFDHVTNETAGNETAGNETAGTDAEDDHECVP